MAVKLLMPKLSDTMEEGVIAAWHKKVGDFVKGGDLLADIETDKATMEYEEFETGVMLYQAPEKSVIKVNDLMAILGKAGEDITALLQSESVQPKAEPTAAVVESVVATTVQPVSTAKVNAVAVTMPKLSDTMTEGVVASWNVKVGDTFKSGAVLAEIETDKATMEYECFESGTVLYLAVEKGNAVTVDGLLCIIGEPNADYKLLIAQGQGGSPAPTMQAHTQIESTALASQATTTQANAHTEHGRVKISPLARQLAKDKGIDLASLQGSGEQGRIVKRDIENFTPPAKTAKAETNASPISANTSFGQESYEEVPVSQMRKVIAKRLGESKHTAPHFYLTMEIEMSAAMEARERMNEASPVKISFNDMVVKACAMALRKHPAVNSSWLGDKIRYNHHVHIGIAVAVEDGLLVPVVRFTDQKSLSQISTETKDLAQKAKTKKLQPADWAGNTFSVSNLGMFGIDEFTAIINPPDACILAVGGIKAAAIVKDGQIKVGNIMKVTLSCDLRVVDGASGAGFLKTLKDLLEAPVRMLI